MKKNMKLQLINPIQLVILSISPLLSSLHYLKSSGSIFRWARPTSINEFSGVRAYVSMCVRAQGVWTCVGGRKFEEAELTITMKMKVISLDEQTRKYVVHMPMTLVRPSKAKMNRQDPKIEFS